MFRFINIVQKRLLGATLALFVSLCVAPCYGQAADKNTTTVSVAMLMGKENIVQNPNWTIYNDMYLQKATLAAFLEMKSAAKRDSIDLEIVSAYRSFQRQKEIWERKWSSPERANMSLEERAIDILKYSSMPGTSRHHWGTDMDLNSVSPRYFTTKEGAKIYNWLVNNAHKYGFYQPYTSGRDRGYAEEVWHWSYMPLSTSYHEVYLQEVSYSDINDFLGCEAAALIQVIENWVCLP